jgi:hypothetical protein
MAHIWTLKKIIALYEADHQRVSETGTGWAMCDCDICKAARAALAAEKERK